MFWKVLERSRIGIWIRKKSGTDGTTQPQSRLYIEVAPQLKKSLTPLASLHLLPELSFGQMRAWEDFQRWWAGLVGGWLGEWGKSQPSWVYAAWLSLAIM